MVDIRTEPSMEDILASIKRIIADDGTTLGGGLNVGTHPVAEPRAFEPVLELTEPVVPTPAPRAATRPAAPQPTAPQPTAAHPAAIAQPATADAPVADAGLVSAGAACASRQSLSALSSMVLRAPGQDNTLDGLVREMLRPMLKDWLDAHLPALVETLVAREIARITAEG